jgi:nicotinamide mononucleotide transporter
LTATNLELIAALLGATSVWLVVRRNIWAFPIGIVMVLLYTYIFYQSKLYSDVLLQIFFAVMQVHGWWAWQRGDKADDDRIAIRQVSLQQWIVAGFIQAAGCLALGYVMDTYTDAASPYMDAFVAVESVIAQLWMNRRFLENWILWIAVNQVAIFLYASKGLWFTTVLYAVFLVMAVAGYWEWKRKIRTTELNASI